jgi:hypothetical protein
MESKAPGDAQPLHGFPIALERPFRQINGAVCGLFELSEQSRSQRRGNRVMMDINNRCGC